MTSPDSPSPRSKAEVVMAEDHLRYGHPLAAWLRHGDLCPARLMAADMASLQGPCDCGLNLAIEAAQEAPAPEGLLAGVRPLIEHRVGLYSLAAEKVGMDPEWAMAVIEDRDPYLAKAVAAIRAAAPPSPAEPPLGREDWAWVLHDLGLNCKPDLTGYDLNGHRDDADRLIERVRAEARPPEGLNAAYETRLYVTADEIEAALKRLHGPVTRDEATIMAAAQAAADALRGGRIVAARLPARGAEPGGER